MSVRLTALSRRVTALAGSVALAAAALLGGAAAASAMSANDEPVVGNINFDAVGSITVHKHVQPVPAGDPATGAEQDVTSPALSGVEFTVEKTTIDLSNAASWDGLSGLTPADVTVDKTVTIDPVTTNADGVAYFGDLSVGVYLVTETSAPESVVQQAAPFLVVIPMSIENTWTYDVHVYPKNSVSAVEKTLDPASDAAYIGLGSEITWNVKSTAPTFNPAVDTLNTYEIVDTLDERLEFVGVENVMYGDEELTVDEHYTVTDVDGVVTFALTEAGRILVLNDSGKDLTFDLITKVVGEGEITNMVVQNINDATIESGDAMTYWGSVNVLKVDAANDNVLQGAQFQVYATDAEGNRTGEPIMIDGEDTFTTDKDGVVRIGSLNVGTTQSRDYILVEVKAPAGYVTPEGDKAETKITVVTGTTTLEKSIENTKQNTPSLPLTGATGTFIFALGGVAIVALGVGMAVRNRREANA